MRIALYHVPIIFFLCLLPGCEWENSDDGDTWDDSYSWINLSGLYRRPGGGYLVAEHTTATTVSSGASNPATTVTESEGTKASGETVISGTLNHASRPSGTPIDAGSVTLVFVQLVPVEGEPAAGGTFTDDGSGRLSGTFNLIGLDPATYNGTGTIDYNTGAWTLTLDSPGFAVDMSATATYTFTLVSQTASTARGAGSTGTPIYSMIVMQQGNLLTFTDSNGATYSGQFGGVQLAGQNPGEPGVVSGTVRVSGEAIAQFQVSGTSANGQGIKIEGTFHLDYSAGGSGGATGGTTSGGGVSGRLDNRTMEGLWLESGGQSGDVLGYSDPISTVVKLTGTTTTSPGTSTTSR